MAVTFVLALVLALHPRPYISVGYLVAIWLLPAVDISLARFPRCGLVLFREGVSFERRLGGGTTYGSFLGGRIIDCFFEGICTPASFIAIASNTQLQQKYTHQSPPKKQHGGKKILNELISRQKTVDGECEMVIQTFGARQEMSDEVAKVIWAGARTVGRLRKTPLPSKAPQCQSNLVTQSAQSRC